MWWYCCSYADMHWNCLAWVFPVTSVICCSGHAFPLPLSQVDVSVYHQVPAGRNSTYRHHAAHSGEERPKCLTIGSRAVGFMQNAHIPQRNGNLIGFIIGHARDPTTMYAHKLG